MSTPAAPKIEVFPTPQAVAEAAASKIVELCRQALEHQDTFSLCLAGGSTPKATYELLATEARRKDIEWARVEIFFGDERTVGPDHPDSNFGMAKKALLDHVPIPGDNINRMKGELDPEEAATQYGQMLKNRFGDTGGFDLLLLGMGDDGHTLSLFPHTKALEETRHRCVANFVPKLDTWRITLTAPFANRSTSTLALITGEKKAHALSQVLMGDGDPDVHPISRIDAASTDLTFMLDAEAAGMNEDDE